MKKILCFISALTLIFMCVTLICPRNADAAPVKKNVIKVIQSEEELQKYAESNNISFDVSQASYVNPMDATDSIVVKEGKPILTKVITNQAEVEKYCKEHNIPLTDESGKKLSKIEILDSTIETESILPSLNIISKPENSVVANYIPLIDYVVEDAPVNFTSRYYCAYAAGPAPGTVTLSQSYTESATFSCNVSIKKSLVSAEVGFDVTRSYTINASYSITPTMAQGGARIYAYPRYQGSTFIVYRLGFQIGAGMTYRPIGSEYVVTYYNS